MNELLAPAASSSSSDDARTDSHALERLYELSSRLWSSSDLREGLGEMLEATIELLGADGGDVHVLDAARGMLVMEAHRGLAPDLVAASRESSSRDSSACGHALRDNARVLIEDVESDPRFATMRPVLLAAGFRGVQSTPLPGRNGEPVGMLSTHFRSPHRPSERDLRLLDLYVRQAAAFIERCGSEEALRASEERYRAIVDDQAEMVCRFRPEGAILFVNGGYARAFGTTPENLVGRSFWEVVAPADHATVKALLDRLTPENPEIRIENRVATIAGERFTLWANRALRFDEHGRLLEAQATGVDITQRKRMEESLRKRARQQQAVARLGEVALRERDLRKVFDRAAGLIAEALDVELSTVLELLPSRDVLLLRAGVGWAENLVGRATVGAGLDSQAGCTLVSDVPVISEDLATETRFSRSPLLAEHGVVSGMSCIVRGSDGSPWGVVGAHSRQRVEFTGDDVSFLVAVANTLGEAIQRERAERALEEADRRKDEFLATLAHELRNPLAPLWSGLELMKRAPADSEVVERARAMMERQLKQLVHLVDDLLDVSRISSGKIVLRREPIDLASVVHQAVETAKPVVEQGEHDLLVELPPERVWVDADPTRLAQVFSNLLHNAAKFTPKGGRIRLVAQREDEMVAVRVQDDGIGISPGLLPAIFEMFTQADDCWGGSKRGLGIGLSLVRVLVDLHGGSIEARSEGAGRGSEFVVRLPRLAPVTNELARDARRAGADVRGSRAAPDGRRVLVVDDNRDAAHGLAQLLRLAGNDTATAYDGVEALETAAEFRPEVVLLDIGLPRLDGYEVARRLRQRAWGKDALLVALTGWGQEEDRRRSADAGFDFHLVKPVEPEVLERLLRSPRRPPR